MELRASSGLFTILSHMVCSSVGILGSTLLIAPGFAQITPDSSLGTESSIVTPGTIQGLSADLIEGGAARGANLFHSFSDFNVNTGQSVYFANPVGIENILSRVTGGSLSNIDGLLGVDGAANLFLLNPNGVVFGPNASLDLSGSFVTSTGSSFAFTDGSEFSAAPTGNPLLTVSVPIGVQFNDQPQGDITNQGNLTVGAGETLTLLGYTVLSRGGLTAEGGAIRLLGNQIHLVDAALIDVSGSQGGDIRIEGDDVALSSGLIDISGTVAGGDLAIYASDELTLGVEVNAAGGGNALFDPPTLDIDAAAATTIVSTVSTGGTSTQSASETINVNVPITVTSGTGGSLAFTDENSDGNLTINLNALIDLSAGHTLSGEGTTVNVNSTTPGIVQNGLAVAATGATVNLAAGTYQEGQTISLTRDVTLNGAGPTTILDGENSHRVLQVNAGVTTSIDNLTLTRGQASLQGGAIENRGTLTISDSTISSNTANSGGAINNGGTLTISGSTFSGNSAFSGGAINNGGTLTISGSTFSGNTANSGGGAINNSGSNSTLNISDSTFSSNMATNSSGGAINNSGSNSTLNISGGTFSSNTANSGGGINNSGSNSTLNISDSTISSNTANSGGGINNSGSNSTLNISGGTISSNTANSGGGINNSGSNSTLNISGGTISSNTANSGGGINNSGSNSTLNISGGTISSNTADNGNGGGGIYNDGTLTITGSIISSNTANRGSSGISGNGGGISNSGALMITDSTISANTANDGVGGGIYNRGTLTITDGTIIGNTAPNSSGNGIYTFFTSVTIGSTGPLAITQDIDSTPNSGASTEDIRLVSPVSITLANGAKITSSNSGTGQGGSVIVQAPRLTLQAGSAIEANAVLNGTGGNLIFNISEALVLQGGSLISTRATAGANTGTAGNIVINTPFLVGAPNQNNDIVSTAANANGGQVLINVTSLLGFTPTNEASFTALRGNAINDISVSSQTGSAGTLTVNALELDPSQGINELPADLSDRSNQITPGCGIGNTDDGSSFVVTGGGGLPPNPSDPIAANDIEVDWITYNGDGSTSPIQQPPDPETDFTQAQGMIIDPDGTVHFVAEAETAVTQQSNATAVRACAVTAQH